MTILLVSLDNSKDAVIGGKHIHQELLKRGWRESGHRIEMVYPGGLKWYWSRVFRKIRQLTGSLGKYEYFRRCIECDKKIIEALVLERSKHVTFDVVSAQDVLAAVAVKSVFNQMRQTPPVVLTLHGYFARETVNYGRFGGDDEPRVAEYCMAIESQALQFVSAVVTVDSRIRRYVLETFRFSKPISVIANAIDDTRFFPVSAEVKSALRHKLKLDVSDQVLIVARRLVNKNGVKYAVQAMQLLERSRDLQACRARLLIIGRGPEEKVIADYIAENRLGAWVKMVGVVPHARIDAYYKAADIVLMPSINSNDIEEATSLSMLEGLACGKVVIASAIGGLKEVIVDHENGLLVRDKDPEALANAIRSVITGGMEVAKMQQSAMTYAKRNSGYREHSSRFILFFSTLGAGARLQIATPIA
jgi:glycosyltransferase involved in cell wall biosynthesis